jgi:signal recognition particle subunit SRP54
MALGKRSKARQAPQQKKSKGKRTSGNPAKRAQQEAAAAADKSAAPANPFGVPGGKPDDLNPDDLGDFVMPPELAKFLDK